ncbi:hypothetical protein ACS0TY_013957 [Phlomoides rotata]
MDDDIELVVAIVVHGLLINPTLVSEDSTDNHWRYFKGCIGALDGTYIPVKVPHPDILRYRNCKGNVSVNVLVVCDRNMNYIYVLSGWEGSAMDSRILRDAVTRTNGLRVPTGSYYLCDGGYTNGNGFLAPYRGVRAHMTVDPYEEEVPDSFTDVNDGNGGEDGFIDQVESSPEWTSWRDNLVMQMWAEYV